MIGANVVLYCKGTGKTSLFYEGSLHSWITETVQKETKNYIFLRSKTTLKIPEAELDNNGIYYCLSEDDNDNYILDHTPLTVYGNVKNFYNKLLR